MSEQTRRWRTENIRADTGMPPYMMFPRFLLDLRLSETARLLYMVLLDRNRLSAGNERFTDDRGDSFVCYTVEDLSRTLHKGRTRIQEALLSLEQEGLICRKRQGIGKANHIYVKLPVGPSDQNPADDPMTGIPSMAGKADTGKAVPRQPEKRSPDVRKTGGLMTGKADRSKNDKNKNYLTRTLSDKAPIPCGRYENVYLTEEEKEMLRREISGWQEYIERLSGYMASTGKGYQDHAATILLWAGKDGAIRKRQDYSCREGESL